MSLKNAWVNIAVTTAFSVSIAHARAEEPKAFNVECQASGLNADLAKLQIFFDADHYPESYMVWIAPSGSKKTLQFHRLLSEDLSPDTLIATSERAERPTVEGGRIAGSAILHHWIEYKQALLSAYGNTYYLTDCAPIEKPKTRPVDFSVKHMDKPPVDGKVSAQKLDELLEKQKLDEEDGWIVVDLTARWCLPCQMQAKHLASWLKARKDASSIQVVAFDFDENKLLMKAWGVDAIPRLMIYKKGVKVRDVSGLKNPSELDQLLP